MVGTALPPAAVALVDSFVGSFIGATRSEVLRFIVVSWLTEHHSLAQDLSAAKSDSEE